jgi:hypothetical protein
VVGCVLIRFMLYLLYATPRVVKMLDKFEWHIDNSNMDRPDHFRLRITFQGLVFIHNSQKESVTKICKGVHKMPVQLLL